MRERGRDSGVRGRGGVFAGISLMLLLVALLASPAAAQIAEGQQVTRSEDVAERAIGQIRSPYCPGLMLEVCPSPEAGALRDSIRELASTGMSEQELVEWMIARHGEEWRAVPARSGRGLFAWLIPPLFLIAGGGYVFHRLRRAEGKDDLTERRDSGISDADRARLESALSELEQEEAEV